jgi:hypothetical protein
MTKHSEVGRELQADNLFVRKVVVVRPRPDMMFTMWVEAIDEKTVTFYAGHLNLHIINFRTPEGDIIDDKGTKIRVYEYLGEI